MRWAFVFLATMLMAANAAFAQAHKPAPKPQPQVNEAAVLPQTGDSNAKEVVSPNE